MGSKNRELMRSRTRFCQGKWGTAVAVENGERDGKGGGGDTVVTFQFLSADKRKLMAAEQER